MWKWGDSGCHWLWASVTLLQPSFDLVTQASAGMWHLAPLAVAGGNLAHKSLPKLGLQLVAPRYPVSTHSMVSTPCQQCIYVLGALVTTGAQNLLYQPDPQQKFRASSYHYCTGEVPPLPGWSPLSEGPEWQLIASA